MNLVKLFEFKMKVTLKGGYEKTLGTYKITLECGGSSVVYTYPKTAATSLTSYPSKDKSLFQLESFENTVTNVTCPLSYV